MDKLEEIQKKKDELEQQNADFQEVQANLESQDGAEVQENDRRLEFLQKTNELSVMGQELENEGKKLEQQAIKPKKKKNRSIVNAETVAKWNETFEKYKAGKSNLDNRIINNQNWWKLRHYGQMGTKEGTEKATDPTQKQENPKSVTAWIANSIINKHADYMDNYPEAVCLPVEESDVSYAQKLSSVLPTIFERANFEDTYSDVAWYKPIAGTGVTAYLWNKDLNNGLGDIDIRKCDILNLFWEPGINKIQDSEMLFHTKLMSNDKLKEVYPKELKGVELTDTASQFAKYESDDSIDTSNCSMVYDVYYHKTNANGKEILHYAKYVGQTLLFASENHEEYDEDGYYHHGKYPFVFDPLFPVEGSPCGFGYIDMLKDPQSDIDELNDSFVKYVKQVVNRKFAVAKNSSVNKKQLLDFTEPLVELESNDMNNAFKEITVNPLPGNALNLMEAKINELKEVGNNRDMSSGGTTSGVTAASAIAAMQEAGSKTSRDQEGQMFRCYREGCYLMLELIAQFYDEKRYFRITNENGDMDFVSFNNDGIKAVEAEDGSVRKPIFDIKVKAQKQSRYTTLAQNELMIQLYQMQVFNPQNAVMAKMLIKNLDFEGKDTILAEISKNGDMQQQIVQYQQMLLQLAQQLDMNGITNGMVMQIQAIIQGNQMSLDTGSFNPDALKAVSGKNDLVERAKDETRQRAAVK